MKTWMFVAEVFWLFCNMSVCPQSDEQTPEDRQPPDSQTTFVDGPLQRWNSLKLERPPPPPD